jgi:hypothetical protein
MKNVPGTNFRENQNKHFVLTNFFSLENRAISDNVEKCCRAERATVDNTAHAFYMLDNLRLQTHRICNTVLLAFARQQWLAERVSMLCSQINCLSC